MRLVIKFKEKLTMHEEESVMHLISDALAVTKHAKRIPGWTKDEIAAFIGKLDRAECAWVKDAL